MKKHFIIVLALLFSVLYASPAFAAANIEQEVINTIPAFADRYVAYAAEHPELDPTLVKIAVNLKLDEENYEGYYATQNPSSLTVLVSKHYAISKKIQACRACLCRSAICAKWRSPA